MLKNIIVWGEIQAVILLDVLGIKMDNIENVNLHIDKICLKSANPLNELVRLKSF